MHPDLGLLVGRGRAHHISRLKKVGSAARIRPSGRKWREKLLRSRKRKEGRKEGIGWKVCGRAESECARGHCVRVSWGDGRALRSMQEWGRRGLDVEATSRVGPCCLTANE